ncbi:hypothetical protein PG984_015519 [Apiospora sp. TS-2023a]
MYAKGELDVGCGNFGYNIHPAQAARKEYERVCYKQEEFTWKGPIDPGFVNFLALYPACSDRAKPVRKDDKSTFRHLYTLDSHGVPYQFNIWWKEGCTLENGGPTEALISDPLGNAPDDDRSCGRYLHANYFHCNNGGVGGAIQVGCLVYEFKADVGERVW